jgi:hypothetical protein
MYSQLLDDLAKTDSIFEEIKESFITLKRIFENKDIKCNEDLYQNLFIRDPTSNIDFKCAFYWTDEDKLFVVYAFRTIGTNYKEKFVYSYIHLDECDICDNFPQTQDQLDIIYYDLKACDDIDEIMLFDDINKMNHDLVEEFCKFKLNYDFYSEN